MRKTRLMDAERLCRTMDNKNMHQNKSVADTIKQSQEVILFFLLFFFFVPL